MRVAIVHDDLMQWGGAERVLLGLTEIYPDAPIYTSVFDSTNLTLWRNFGSKKIITSFLQKIPGWKNLYKTLLPLYPMAFEQFDFSDFDLVISQTTRFAKSIITKPRTKHVCFCHTPPRFLWHLSGTKNFSWGELLMTKLRIGDQIWANRVDVFLAGSKNARKRIKKIYGADAKVVYPFVDMKRFEKVETFDGGYFVAAGRQSNYKRFDLARDACFKLGIELKVLDGSFSDGLFLEILAGCKGLIIPGTEDFGLVSLEAQALGKGVIAFREGGALETIVEDETGIFFDRQTVEDLSQALAKFKPMDKEKCIENAKRFGKENFIKQFVQAVDCL